MDNHYIRDLRDQKKSVGKRLYAAVCLMLVSSLLLATTSFAWLTLSQAPEVTNVTTTLGANGNLEIALGKNIGESTVGDSFAKNEVTVANRTWGNLIDLSDESYGLQTITLRPAILNSAGGAVNTLHPFAYSVYGADGRVEQIFANNVFAGTYNGTMFSTSVNEYGVRGIGATAYVAPGVYDTFGPMSQRQEIFYDALNDLWQMTYSSYSSLCYNSRKVLMSYCLHGTDVGVADFNLNAFSRCVEDVVSAANEELRLSFTVLAASEATSGENYHQAMALMQEAYPDYESVRILVAPAIRATGATDAAKAISELRAFQTAAAQLRTVMASGIIDGSDGYSMEEIVQTVGLIFDLEQTNFTASNYGTEHYYSNVVPGLLYTREYDSLWKDWDSNIDGFSIYNLTNGLYYESSAQDNENREAVASNVQSQLYSIYSSLALAELDHAIADLYVSHWSYWDSHKDEVEELTAQIEALEDTIAKKQLEENTEPLVIEDLQNQLKGKQSQLQRLIDEEVYAINDISLESIRTVMTDTIEALRKYTLWSIAYYACDGRVPDDAYHRMQEIAESSTYIHPRTAYQALLNYGVAPEDGVTQMVEAFGKLEQELVFLPVESVEASTISWLAIRTELQRVFGNITHNFSLYRYYSSYSSGYSPEDTSMPTEVMTRIRAEIEDYKVASGNSTSGGRTEYHITYASYDDSYQPWARALGFLNSFYPESYPFDYGTSAYTLEDWQFTTEHDMWYSEGFHIYISIGVGSEDNFNESGLTVRQTRFQTAQGKISNYQGQLIASAVNADKDLVMLLTEMMAGQDVSLSTISAYLDSLEKQLEYAESMMYQAALAMAASDYAQDDVYRRAYSDNGPKTAADLIGWLQGSDFDGNVLSAFEDRMELLNSQQALLNQSAAMLKNYQNADGSLATENISAAEAAALLNPVLDTSGMTLYGYVAETQIPGGTPTYARTVLYEGYGSPAVQILGNKATVGSGEPITLFGDVYLSLGRSLSGGMLALAKTQTETYAPPEGSVSAGDIGNVEARMNRQAYAIGTDADVFTMNLCTEDAPYALATNLWTYTGNTNYISANNILVDLYGYCIDLSLRTNAANSDLLLQTDAVNRIYSGEDVKTDTAMGGGSYMEFTLISPSYSLDMAKEYMSCLRVAITDTNTGYIYGYASLDMTAAEVLGVTIKAPLRMYDKYTGAMITNDNAQYICRLDQNLEKNLTVYVYLDGAKASQAITSATTELSLAGVLNLQFSSSADLKPAMLEDLR